jgi:hypothetical protein
LGVVASESTVPGFSDSCGEWSYTVCTHTHNVVLCFAVTGHCTDAVTKGTCTCRVVTGNCTDAVTKGTRTCRVVRGALFARLA